MLKMFQYLGSKYDPLFQYPQLVYYFFYCEKLTFLTAEKIMRLIILKANDNVETINTYILNLGQKLSSSAYFCGR